MSAISKTTSSSVSSETDFIGGGRVRPLTVLRSPTARRVRLAVDPRDGTVRLTLPRRASEARGRAWAEAQRRWVEAALAALPSPRPIAPGGTLPFRGEDMLIDWSAAAPRAPRPDGDRLVVGGPIEALPRRVLAWARRQALVVLEAETRALAAREAIAIGRVSVGDPRGRWGSCSARGDLRFSWRLILAPRFVLTATVAHEVAHRLHMDHGAAFHAAERRLLGTDPAPSRAWLRAHGAALHWVGVA